MKIALDAQQLFEKEKTGVGWNAKCIIDYLTDDSTNQYILNYAWRQELANEKEIVNYYRKKGCIIRKSGFIKTLFCRAFDKIHPIPYSMIYRDKVDVTQFFNYVIPKGVKGKKVTFVYDMAYKAYPETMNKKNRIWLEKNISRSCEEADVITTSSCFSKGEIIKYLCVSENKIAVVYCGIDHDKYHPHYSMKEVGEVKKRFGIRGEYFLYLGTLEPRKNIVEIIEAYGLLAKRYKECPELVLAGRKGWLYDAIFAKIAELKLERKVICTGYITENEKVRLICGAVAFLFPSLYEGFGIPPLEAMACGVPTIVSDCASLPEVVGDAGIKVPLKEPEKIAEAMELLMSDKKLWEEKRIKGLERSKEFSWDRTVEQLRKVYCEIS